MDPQQVGRVATEALQASVAHLRKVHSDLMILPRLPTLPGSDTSRASIPLWALGTREPRFPGCQDEDLTPEEETRLVPRPLISVSILDDHGKLLDVDVPTG